MTFTWNFNSGADGFLYRDDTFRDTQQPTYKSGKHIASGGFQGGALQVDLGGINATSVDGMSGGWSKTFAANGTDPVQLTFRYKLTQSTAHDRDEFSQVLVAVDNKLVGANGNDYVANIKGAGSNYEFDKTTGWKSVTLDLGKLTKGDHTITLGGYTNKKDAANEWATLRFDDVVLKGAPSDAPTWSGDPAPAPVAEAVSPPSSAGLLGGTGKDSLSWTFGSSAQGFTYKDGAFHGTKQPTYESGKYIATGGYQGGGLQVDLGGINNTDIKGMSGGWDQTFTASGTDNVLLTFRYNLTQGANYERDEYSDVLAALDGKLLTSGGKSTIARVTGDGYGGPSKSTG